MTNLLIQEPPRQSRVQVYDNTYNLYRINFFDDIGPISDYQEELAVFKNAREEDLIEIYVSNDGGSMDTACILYQAMQECDAPIVCEIGSCSSAATAICLGADSWKVNPMSNWMVHSASFGPPYAKVPDVEAHVVHTKKLVNKFVKEVYSGFLTEEELEDVINRREEMYFDSDELLERLNKYDEYRHDKFVEEIEKQREAIAEAVKEEESEIDLNDPTTWPDGSKVKLKKSIGIFKRGLTLNLSQIHSREITIDDGTYTEIVGEEKFKHLELVQDNAK